MATVASGTEHLKAKIDRQKAAAKREEELAGLFQELRLLVIDVRDLVQAEIRKAGR